MSRSSLSAADRDRLLQAARAAAQRAYAPYSKFQAGAAALTERGELFRGCNVENASYGLTICAERAAIFSAVAGEGAGVRIRALAVLTQSEVAASPCGACRQVILEFGPDSVVLFRGPNGLEERAAAELLPDGFRLP